jgi:hypothetical protein
VVLIRQGRIKRFKFHHTTYSGQELRDRLEQVGFTNVRLCGSLEGDDYGAYAQGLIVVGCKPTGGRLLAAKHPTSIVVSPTASRTVVHRHHAKTRGKS